MSLLYKLNAVVSQLTMRLSDTLTNYESTHSTSRHRQANDNLADFDDYGISVTCSTSKPHCGIIQPRGSP
jgi:hypothetical protein